MRIAIVGPPGGGKGSIAHKLEEDYGFKHIGMGDILREEISKKTEIGLRIEKILKEGKLVDSQTTNKLLFNKVIKLRDWIIEGYPRTTEQAEFLIENLPIEAILLLNAKKEVCKERIIYRRICPKCNRIYNLKTLPPKNDNLCDVCNVKLIQRNDDTEEVFNKLDSINREYSELSDSLFKSKAPISLVLCEKSIIESLKRIARYSSDICEIVINIYVK